MSATAHTPAAGDALHQAVTLACRLHFEEKWLRINATVVAADRYHLPLRDVALEVDHADEARARFRAMSDERLVLAGDIGAARMRPGERYAYAVTVRERARLQAAMAAATEAGFVDDDTLGPGERIVDGQRLYSAAWLGDNVRTKLAPAPEAAAQILDFDRARAHGRRPR
jgi:hypothetical protein